MYQNFIVTITSKSNLNENKYVNLKISKDFFLNPARPDVMDLINDYCPKDSSSNILLTNLFITSLDLKTEFRYYYYKEKLYIRCENLIWEENVFGVFEAKFRVNILPIDEYNMDDELLLFKDEDMEDFTDDVNDAFYLDLTDPYYTNGATNKIDATFMQDLRLTEELIIDYSTLMSIENKELVGLKLDSTSIDNDYVILDFDDGYEIHILDPNNTPEPETTITNVINMIEEPEFNFEYLIGKTVYKIKFNDSITWEYLTGELLEDGESELDSEEFDTNPAYMPSNLKLYTLVEAIQILLNSDNLTTIEIIYEKDPIIYIDYKPIMVYAHGDLILTKEVDELLEVNDILDIEPDFNTIIKNINIFYGDNDKTDFTVIVELDNGEYGPRCCNPDEYARFSKFDQNDTFYYKMSGRGRWIKWSYEKNYAQYIIDFIKMNTPKSLKIVSSEQLDIYTEYMYKNSSSMNKTHYIGILDESDHSPCDFDSLVNFNCDDTLTLGKDETTIIYSDQIEEDDESLLDLDGNTKTNQSIGVPLEMILKYDNVDLTVLQDNVLYREWEKVGRGCM